MRLFLRIGNLRKKHTRSPSNETYTFVTPSHEKLFTEIFFPSVPASFELVIHKMDVPGPGRFMDKTYMKSLSLRVLHILSSIRDNRDKVIAWSDVDVFFTSEFSNDVAWSHFNCGRESLVFSRLGLEGPQACFGFFMMKCDDIALKFWEEVCRGVFNSSDKYDQIIGHDLLLKGETPFGILPDSYYNHCFGTMPEEIFYLYHAACVEGVDEKLKVLKEVRERFLPKE